MSLDFSSHSAHVGFIFGAFLEHVWGIFGVFLDGWFILGCWGHLELGTAMTKCFEHLDDEKHILDPGHLYP